MYVYNVIEHMLYTLCIYRYMYSIIMTGYFLEIYLLARNSAFKILFMMITILI